MIQIRNDIFETNSSSSHSIVITIEDKILDKVGESWQFDDEHKLRFWNEDDLSFGRTPFEILADWYDRLRFVIASIGETQMDEIKNACNKHIDNFNGFNFPIDRWEKCEYHGYVDHQSYGLLTHTLDKHNISIEDFIFNDKYIVIIDGDEYNIFNTLLKTPMFNSDSIECIENAIDNYEFIDEDEEEN